MEPPEVAATVAISLLDGYAFQSSRFICQTSFANLLKTWRVALAPSGMHHAENLMFTLLSIGIAVAANGSDFRTQSVGRQQAHITPGQQVPSSPPITNLYLLLLARTSGKRRTSAMKGAIAKEKPIVLPPHERQPSRNGSSPLRVR